MNKKRFWIITLLTLGVLLAATAGLSAAQEPGPRVELEPHGPVSIDANVSSSFNYQGVLKESGSPVTGSRDMTFRLYSDTTCTTQVGGNIVEPAVPVADGLFSVDLAVSPSNIYGQGLWLEVEVGGTAIGCQEILPVPYAFSLRPGANISGEQVNWDAIHAVNTATTGNSYGVYGRSDSPDGVGGYFRNNGGVDIKAAGSGIIQSTANSYLWISGNDARPHHHDDSTEIDMDSEGGALIYQGGTVGNKNIMLPITIPGPLYGQDVTLTDLDIFWLSSSGFEAVSAVILRLQMGVGACENIVFDNTTDYFCDDAIHPEGCTIHYDLTNNNVLTENAGILYLTLELGFSSATDYLQLGGVRLTLEHE